MAELRCFLLVSTLSLLTALAGAEGHRHAPKTYELVHVNWSLKFDESKGRIWGDVTNTLKPLSKLSSFALDCSKLDVQSVTVNGVTAAFTTGDDLLTIRLSKPAAKGEKLDVRVIYTGVPQAGIYFVPQTRAFPARTSVVYTQGEMVDTRYWLPTYDWPDNRASFENFIEVPKGYYALSNGKLVEVLHKGDKDVFHWKLDEPQSTYLISLVAGKYEEGQDAGASIPTYYYVPEGLKDWGEAAFGGTSKIVDFYGRITGFKYPYTKFSQSAVPDFMFGGMENTTCVTQTITAIYPPRVKPLADATGLVVFLLIGRRSHGLEQAGSTWFLEVLWPIAVAWIVGALALRLYTAAERPWLRLVGTVVVTVTLGGLLRHFTPGHSMFSAFNLVLAIGLLTQGRYDLDLRLCRFSRCTRTACNLLRTTCIRFM